MKICNKGMEVELSDALAPIDILIKMGFRMSEKIVKGDLIR